MKKFFIILLLLLATTCTYSQRIALREQSTTMTLPATVTAYAANQLVQASPYTVSLMTPIFRPANISDGYHYTLKLAVDSLSLNGDFILYALKDTVDVWSAIANNHSILQGTQAFSDNLIFQTPISVIPEGTWAAGARVSNGTALFIYPFVLPGGDGVRNIYWILKATSAWMPQANGHITLTVILGS
jgi:hypothetical protein